MKKLALAIVLSLFAAPAVGESAEAKAKEHALASPRITLGDIADVPEELRAVDLGPSPLPGSSRVLKRAELEGAIPEANRRGLNLPVSVRVVRKSRTLSIPDIEGMVEQALQVRGLPKGATLTRIRPRAAAVVADGFDSAVLEFPKPPRREGKHLTAATLQLMQSGEQIGKLVVNIEFALGKEAAIADVPKGSKVQFTIRRGAVMVSALATTAADADLGDSVLVTVSDSGKVLRGRVESSNVVSEAK